MPKTPTNVSTEMLTKYQAHGSPPVVLSTKMEAKIKFKPCAKAAPQPCLDASQNQVQQGRLGFSKMKYLMRRVEPHTKNNRNWTNMVVVSSGPDQSNVWHRWIGRVLFDDGDGDWMLIVFYWPTLDVSLSCECLCGLEERSPRGPGECVVLLRKTWKTKDDRSQQNW